MFELIFIFMLSSHFVIGSYKVQRYVLDICIVA